MKPTTTLSLVGKFHFDRLSNTSAMKARRTSIISLPGFYSVPSGKALLSVAQPTLRRGPSGRGSAPAACPPEGQAAAGAWAWAFPSSRTSKLAPVPPRRPWLSLQPDHSRGKRSGNRGRPPQRSGSVSKWRSLASVAAGKEKHGMKIRLFKPSPEIKKTTLEWS